VSRHLQLTADAISARLQLVFPPARFQHEMMPAKITAKTWGRLTARTPFIGLGWNTVEGDRDTSRLFRGETHWTAFLVAKNVAGTRLAYVGDRQGPGLFSMVEAATAVLHGWTLPDIGTCFVSRAGNLYAEGWDADDAAMAGVDFTIGCTWPAADPLDGAAGDPLTTLGIVWDFNLTELDDTRTAA
jgi:hypothetical protein